MIQEKTYSVTIGKYAKILRNSCTTKYSDFKTRSNREEYIIFLLSSFLLYKILDFLAKYFVEGLYSLLVLTNIVMIIPAASLFIRRTNDIGASNWLILLISLIIIGFFLSSEYFGITDIGIMRWLDIPVIAMLLLFFICPGTTGTNRHGLPSVN